MLLWLLGRWVRTKTGFAASSDPSLGPSPVLGTASRQPAPSLQQPVRYVLSRGQGFEIAMKDVEAAELEAMDKSGALLPLDAPASSW